MQKPDLPVARSLRALRASRICALILAAGIGTLISATVAIVPVVAQAPPVGGPSAPQAPKVCKECQYLADDVAFIQGRIDQTQRSQASMRKYANLQDPNVQQALKDDDAKVASLQQLLAKQNAKLAKCVEDKCKPPPPATVPVTPSLPAEPQQPPPPPPPPPPQNSGGLDGWKPQGGWGGGWNGGWYNPQGWNPPIHGKDVD